MKKGEQPEVSAKWWKGSQPKGLKSAGKLDDALKDYDTAKAKLGKSNEPADAAAASTALDAIEGATKAVIAEAGKAKGAPEMEWTADALKKMDRLVAVERKWIGENTEEENDGDFAAPEAYRPYLLKSLKRLRSSGQLNFGVVLGKKAEEHRLALNKAKGGKALGGMLMRETGLHAMTFGIAMNAKGAGEMEAEQSEGESEDGEGMGDEKSNVLILSLEGRQLPGLKKKLTKMLKKFKVPFKSVKLMVEGKEVEDVDDPEDTDTEEYDDDVVARPQISAEALIRELAALVPKIAGITDATRKASLTQMANLARSLLRGNNLEEAQSTIASLREALAQDGGAPTGTATTGAEAYDKYRQIWLGARTRVNSEIEKLRKALVDTYKDDGVAGEIEAQYRAKVLPVGAALDVKLLDALAAAAVAPDNEKPTRIAEVQGILKTCQSYIDGEPLLADLDGNPFVPVAIRSTMTATVAALEKAIH